MDHVAGITESLLRFTIPERLRQRLTQRPAAGEAAAELTALSRQLENDDLRVFAATCSEGVAACESAAENSISEAEAYMRSARLHLDEEKEAYNLNLPTLWDSLYFAIDATNKAADIYEQNCATHQAVTALVRLSEAMLHLARPEDAVKTLHKALELNKTQNGTRERLVVLRTLADVQTQAGLLVDALLTYEEIIMVSGVLKHGPAKVIGWYRELARQCEIRQVLILLIVEPMPAKMSPFHKQMMEWYLKEDLAELKAEGATGPQTFVSFLSPVEFLKLKDFVLAVTGKDMSRTYEASEKLMNILDRTECSFVEYLTDLVPHYVVRT
ncbi:hypothetical protein RvY_06973 [Ramazzottius varieornatus]|uniref:Uncharacterized protein n=1 Tax=Ramazzottius varieornatus TaxID=947166 RepID=A0A1D1V0F3_RAMVA|nr:hypothetical protein RvY_06973 [Ramazzottius varieornatus]